MLVLFLGEQLDIARSASVAEIAFPDVTRHALTFPQIYFALRIAIFQKPIVDVLPRRRIEWPGEPIPPTVWRID